MAYARAMLADAPDVIAVRGDARRPFDFITHDAVRDLINFSRPVGVLFASVLHFITDEERPHGSVAWVRDRVAPGSYLVLSHVTSDGTDPAAMTRSRTRTRRPVPRPCSARPPISRGSSTGSTSRPPAWLRCRAGAARSRSTRPPPSGSSAPSAASPGDSG